MMSALPHLDQTTAQHIEDWREERLRDARSVLADIANHPSSLVLLACRVVVVHSRERIKIEDAEETAALLRSKREVRQ